MDPVLLYDTTLRDGMQREGMSGSVDEKVRIAVRVAALGVKLIEGVFHPHLLMIRLATNPDFRVLLADRIYQRFFNGGVLTPQSGPQRYTARANEISTSPTPPAQACRQ